MGRAWLTQDIEEWLDDPQGGRLCTVYGGPGVGKSAFAAQYTYHSWRVAASIFFEHGKPGMGLLIAFNIYRIIGGIGVALCALAFLLALLLALLLRCYCRYRGSLFPMANLPENLAVA